MELPAKASVHSNMQQEFTARGAELDTLKARAFGGFFIRAESPTARVLVKEHIFSQSRQVASPYYGSPGLLINHQIFNQPQWLTVGNHGWADTEICYQSRCLVNHVGLNSQQPSILSVVWDGFVSRPRVTGQQPGHATLYSQVTGPGELHGTQVTLHAFAGISVYDATPVIIAIVPNTIPAGGSQIAEIYGINFGSNPTVSATGGIQVTRLYHSPTQINVRFDAPVTPPGSYNVMVTSNGLTGVFLQAPGGGSQAQSATKPVGVVPPPQFTITTRAFIPVNHVGPDPIACLPSGIYHKGDDRTFSASSTKYRVQQKVVYQSGPGASVVSHTKSVGETKGYAINAITNNGTIDAADDDATLGDCHLLHARGFAQTNNMHATTTASGVKISGDAKNPLDPELFAPGITWEYIVNFTLGPSGSSYSLAITHDCFPAHEVYLGSQPIYTFAPSGYSFGSDIAWCLYGFDQIITLRTGAIIP